MEASVQVSLSNIHVCTMPLFLCLILIYFHIHVTCYCFEIYWLYFMNFFQPITLTLSYTFYKLVILFQNDQLFSITLNDYSQYQSIDLQMHRILIWYWEWHSLSLLILISTNLFFQLLHVCLGCMSLLSMLYCLSVKFIFHAMFRDTKIYNPRCNTS